MTFRPMKPPSEVPATCPNFYEYIKFPIFGCVKLDGIRGVSFGNCMYSSSMKPLASRQLQRDFTSHDFCDYEIVEGDPKDDGVYNRTQSHVMSANKPGNIHCYLINYFEDIDEPFEKRYERLLNINFDTTKFTVLEQKILYSLEELFEYEQWAVDSHYEGLILNAINGIYKANARATMREGICFKVKRFVDDEAILLAVEEGHINLNEAKIDERGLQFRSSAKAGKVLSGRVGRFICDYHGRQITIGPGKFKHDELAEILKNPKKYIGRLIKFRHFDYGKKNTERQPIALGWRSRIDL